MDAQRQQFESTTRALEQQCNKEKNNLRKNSPKAYHFLRQNGAFNNMTEAQFNNLVNQMTMDDPAPQVTNARLGDPTPASCSCSSFCS